jgi:hypothetical protein
MSDGGSETEAIAQRQLEERAGRLRQAMDEALRELVQPLELPAGDGPAAVAPALRAVRDALQAISVAASQKEILEALLSAAAGCYSRAALFVMKKDGLRGWAGRGFDPESACGDRDVPRIVLTTAGDHLLARAAQSKSLVIAGHEGPGEAVIAALGGARPGEAGSMPILLRDRPVALLYGDDGGTGGRPDALWLEIIGRIGGLALANLAVEPPRRQAPDPHRGEARPAAGEETGTTRAAARPADPEVQPLLADLADLPRREEADGGQPLSEEVRRWHQDARRFASLLISELLLYNEEAVIQGRRNRDLRQRLATEIERSRQAYASRVSPEIVRSTSFFDEELIRVLAEGDASLFKG